MIREAIEYIVSLGNTKITHVEGIPYSNGHLTLVKAPTVAPIVVTTLAGLVDYLKSDFDSTKEVMVHIESPTSVHVYSHYNRDNVRNNHISAKAILPEFHFGRWYGTEEFNIALQSVFVSNEARDTMLKIVGNIRDEAVRNFGDDGVSQSVSAKAGVATVADVKVPNPVVLKPYRTFVEVKQPESSFVFRMRTGQQGPECALFESDGGAWKVEAIDIIQAHLKKELASKIETGAVVLIS